jgi:hypothetical protein
VRRSWCDGAGVVGHGLRNNADMTVVRQRQWTAIDSTAEPTAVTERPDGTIEVAVHLVALNLLVVDRVGRFLAGERQGRREMIGVSGLVPNSYCLASSSGRSTPRMNRSSISAVSWGVSSGWVKQRRNSRNVICSARSAGSR